jgi:hypothetical protein
MGHAASAEVLVATGFWNRRSGNPNRITAGPRVKLISTEMDRIHFVPIGMQNRTFQTLY